MSFSTCFHTSGRGLFVEKYVSNGVLYISLVVPLIISISGSCEVAQAHLAYWISNAMIMIVFIFLLPSQVPSGTRVNLDFLVRPIFHLSASQPLNVNRTGRQQSQANKTGMIMAGAGGAAKHSMMKKAANEMHMREKRTAVLFRAKIAAAPRTARVKPIPLNPVRSCPPGCPTNERPRKMSPPATAMSAKALRVATASHFCFHVSARNFIFSLAER